MTKYYYINNDYDFSLKQNEYVSVKQMDGSNTEINIPVTQNSKTG